MEIYLDNAATTPLLPEVISKISDVSNNIYGNPSSVHELGLRAEKLVREAREKIADAFDVTLDEVYFTSGATESNNTAIFGAVYANAKRGKRIITSKIEHPSVLSCFEKLEKEGFDVVYLNVDKNGIIDMEELTNALNNETIFVSVMTVNNELGSIQPINEIIKLKNKYNFVFHTDAVQAFNKVPAHIFDKADIISISGHKIHSVKGVGALIVKKGVKINPLILGGGQERGFRSGTENVIGIAAFGEAVANPCDMSKLLECKKALVSELKGMKNITFNCYNEETSAPHILNVTFHGKRGEVILHALEAKGIYVSTGSACHSNKFGESHVLKAIGLDKEDIGATVRFSFGKFNTVDEVKEAGKIIKETVEKL